jgi:hypothetical protein
MKPNKYTALSADWDANLKTAAFSSPSKDSGPNQMIVFSDRVQDGTISASVTPISGQPDENWGYELRECAVLFRYHDREHFYLAGIGGFGMKFFIAKVSASEWRLLDGIGLAGSLKSREQYHLAVGFSGDRITLFHNDVPILTAIDSTYSEGLCGLRTNRTEAVFKNIDIQAVRPKCFAIMPFDPQLDSVYRVIKDVVEQHGMDCLRADERFISEPIIEDVKRQIAAAKLVVVDFTNKNPNVYFEAGLADAWKKPWIVLAQSIHDLAFDVRHLRSIIYSQSDADSGLRKNLEQALKEIMEGAQGENQ